MMLNWNFLRGWAVQTKKLLLGGVDISGTTHCRRLTRLAIYKAIYKVRRS